MFKKRVTVLQNLTYIAIMSAINVIFALLATILPFLFFILIFLLPLTSLIVYVFCMKRYFPLYAVVTIGLCLIFNLWRVTDTIFYVIPSILTGFIFGICIEKKVPMFFTILISTLSGVAATYASIPLIQLLIEVNTIDFFLKFFKLDEFAYKDYLPPIFIFVISSIQMALTYLIIREEIKKLGIESNETDVDERIMFYIEIGLVALSVIFAFIYGPISFLILCFTIYVGVYQTAILIGKNVKIGLISLGLVVTSTIFIYALLNQFIAQPYQFLLLLLPSAIMSSISFSNYYLDKRKNNDKL